MKRTIQTAIGVVEDAWFERRYDFETAEFVGVRDLEIDSDEAQHSHAYQPTRVRHLRKLLQELRLPKNFVFVDVGCGKGRVLLIAASYGFRRVVGVEISPRLGAVAQQHAEKFRQRSGVSTEIEVLCTNITRYEFRNDEGVIYLFWPFDRSVMQQFLGELCASLRTHPRELWLIFNNYQYAGMFDGDEHFQHHRRFIYGPAEFDIFSYQPAQRT